MNNNLKIIAIVVVVLIALVSRILKKFRDECPDFQPPQLLFRYTAAEVTDQRGFARFHAWFLVMLIFVCIAMAVVTQNTAGFPWMRRGMFFLSAAACFLGYMETLLLMISKPKAAPLFGTGKWIVFAVWVVCMFVSLFITSWSY